MLQQSTPQPQKTVYGMCFPLHEQLPFSQGSDDLQLHAIVCRTSLGAAWVQGGSIIGCNDLLIESLFHPKLQGSMFGGSAFIQDFHSRHWYRALRRCSSKASEVGGRLRSFGAITFLRVFLIHIKYLLSDIVDPSDMP